MDGVPDRSRRRIPRRVVTWLYMYGEFQFFFSPQTLGKWFNLTNIFQRGLKPPTNYRFEKHVGFVVNLGVNYPKNTLPKAKQFKAPENRQRVPKGKETAFQSSNFQGKAGSFREGKCNSLWLKLWLIGWLFCTRRFYYPVTWIIPVSKWLITMVHG